MRSVPIERSMLNLGHSTQLNFESSTQSVDQVDYRGNYDQPKVKYSSANLIPLTADFNFFYLGK